MSFEFTNSYNEDHSYEIKESEMCPICNKKMSKHNNEKILDRNGSKNILMGVGCDHPICKGYPINFNEIYYKCINCNLDYCKNHAEKKNMKSLKNFSTVSFFFF